MWLYEAPSEKEAMKLGAMASKVMEYQTLTALSRDEAMKLMSEIQE